MRAVFARKATYSMPIKTKSKKKDKVPAAPATALPELQALPRGQERLPDGLTRLKTGEHNLGENAKEYDVFGKRLQLSGLIIVAGRDVNWLCIGECQKCREVRPDGVTVTSYADGYVVLTFKCSNVTQCDLGGRTYIQVHSPGRFTFKTV